MIQNSLNRKLKHFLYFCLFIIFLKLCTLVHVFASAITKLRGNFESIDCVISFWIQLDSENKQNLDKESFHSFKCFSNFLEICKFPVFVTISVISELFKCLFAKFINIFVNIFGKIRDLRECIFAENSQFTRL